MSRKPHSNVEHVATEDPGKADLAPQTTEDRDARNQYIDDLLQGSKTVADQSAVLRQRAPSRIKAAQAATREAGLRNTATDDSLDHYHVVERFLHEKAFYPPHEKRTESRDYAVIHHQIAVVDDRRCLVCGVRHSTLGDVKENPFGAVQIETHHHTIEWALANAVDPAKFNQHIRPGLQRIAEQRKAAPGYAELAACYKEFDETYGRDMSEAEIKAWVDHGYDNLWPLCDVHHRHRYVGIHAITYPVWGPQDVVNATLVSDLIASARETTDKGRAKPAAPAIGGG